MVRVLFKNDGEPAPVAHPPLLPSERMIVVNFMPPSKTILWRGAASKFISANNGDRSAHAAEDRWPAQG
jgi:hypothetical protein